MHWYLICFKNCAALLALPLPDVIACIWTSTGADREHVHAFSLHSQPKKLPSEPFAFQLLHPCLDTALCLVILVVLVQSKPAEFTIIEQGLHHTA